ncbi:hypothetical protein GUJ93_ZPchr0009g621 [Zizania palustris]|uniref:Uncharacterized protein n=1 Tax=Zizania palustris TaxID=103762 RepID=A0A8J5R4A1_ZIZPA|nr:hypothetical protein GUJ93_ZPchr0009g621 [Zizania palustris]
MTAEAVGVTPAIRNLSGGFASFLHECFFAGASLLSFSLPSVWVKRVVVEVEASEEPPLAAEDPYQCYEDQGKSPDLL